MGDEQRELLLREFPVEVMEGGDGRTLEARIVPYNTPTRVVDLPENGGTGKPYMESWSPGAFDKQSGAIGRVKVWLNFEHQRGLQGIVGHGVELDSRDDALYGTFRVHENSDGNKALQMVRDGLLTGISLEAIPLRTRRTAEGIVERVRAHLEKVSLCRMGAYEDATVLALREAPDPAPNADYIPLSIDQTGRLHVDLGDHEPASAPEPAEPSDAELALQRIGWQPLLVRAVTRKPWSGDASRFTDEQYERSCLVCRSGDDPPKQRCSLPVLEPNGDVNANALAAAAAVLSGARGGLGGVSAAEKATAARKLRRYYTTANMDPPPSLVALASR